MIDKTNDYHTLDIIHNTLSCGLKSYLKTVSKEVCKEYAIVSV